MTKKHYSKQRFELEEFEEEDFYKLRNSYTKKKNERRHTNWKRSWLDHQHDFESYDKFFGK